MRQWNRRHKILTMSLENLLTGQEFMILYDPENENVRRESKLSVPDRNIEPAVATTPGTLTQHSN